MMLTSGISNKNETGNFDMTEPPQTANTWQSQIDDDGDYRRRPTSFHSEIRADGSTNFSPAAGRYHLYVSLACPWAHRTLIYRKLKGLEDAISVNVVDPLLPEQGWTFEQNVAGATGDTVNHLHLLREVYGKASAEYDGSITVPVLWDKELNTIVNNESSEIIRMLNAEFQDFARYPEVEFYPEPLRGKIDELNDWIYPEINNGVYQSGFARKQSAYSRAVKALFNALDRVEAILANSRYLTGDQLTEADVRLFTTLVRFDAVYVTHFKCNIRRIIDYPNLWGYTRDIYQVPGISETVNMEHIKRHYFESHLHINPFGIVPEGPELDFEAPHGRG
jgi:putative glutathione S-transferase